MKRIVALLLALALVLSACTKEESTPDPAPEAPSPVEIPAAPEEPAPETPAEPVEVAEPEVDNSWQVGAPEDQGMDSSVFEAMHQALEGAPVYSVLTVRDGVIVDEYYQEGYDEESVFAFHSASKSVTSALLGIALEEGFICSVDDLLSDYLPQVAQLSDGKQNLTLRQLLTHTSGIEWYEWGGGASNWVEFRSAENWVDYILGRRQVYEPGTVFNYSTGNTHLLAAALEEAVGQPLFDYGEEKLFGPLGMEHTSWGCDPQGIADGGNGLIMSARDAAKFGQLFLQKGQWKGQQLVPADWVETSTSAQNNGAGDGTGSYGFQWWIRQFNGYDGYYAFGAWGQYIIVIPELELVCVIASPGPQSSYASRAYFTDYVLKALLED